MSSESEIRETWLPIASTTASPRVKEMDAVWNYKTMVDRKRWGAARNELGGKRFFRHVDISGYGHAVCPPQTLNERLLTLFPTISPIHLSHHTVVVPVFFAITPTQPKDIKP